jgi:hypothetical protein
MILILLLHQWNSFIRSRNASRNIAIQIFIGLIFFYFLMIAIIIGISVDTSLKQRFPRLDTIKIFNSFILYYFSFDIILRFLLQSMPTLTVQPYLIQNIKRRTLVGFLNIKSLFSFFNLLPLVLFIPFSITVISKQYSTWVVIIFIINIILLCIANNFLVLFIKRKTILNNWWLIGFFIIILLSITGDYLGSYSIRTLSTNLFTSLLEFPWATVFVGIWAFFSYYNNYSFLKKNLYLEEKASSSKVNNASNSTWIRHFGITGELIMIDIKMMLRNKRPRSTLILSSLILMYGFIIYKPDYINQNQLGFILLGAIFITGIFMVNYGQFLLAWQSSHFDEIMISNIGIRSYIESKFILMIVMSTIALLPSLFYGFISWKIIPIEIAAYLFNVGIHTVLVTLFATRNYKGFDISKSASFNYQGIGVVQWVYSLAIVLVGLIIYLPVALFFNTWLGIVSVGILGLIFLLLQNWWIDIIVKQFKKNKYKILSGFREK